MPTAARQPCATPWCPHLRPCPEHKGRQTPRIYPPHYSVYSSTEWKPISKQVIREEPLCHWCGVNRSEVADHVIELADGGAPFDRANLVGSCTPCNVAKGQRAAQTRRRRG